MFTLQRSLALHLYCVFSLQPKVPKKDKPNETLTFRAVLLTKCQKEFESDTIVEGDLDRRRKELDKASDVSLDMNLLIKSFFYIFKSILCLNGSFALQYGHLIFVSRHR